MYTGDIDAILQLFLDCMTFMEYCTLSVTYLNPRINASGVWYNRSEPPAFIKSCCIGLLRKNLCSCILVTATN